MSAGGGEGVATDERPLQAELFSVIQLERHARAMSARHTLVTRQRNEADRLLPRLRANEVMFRAAYAFLTAALVRGRQLTPAAEWFIDNFHVIDEQVRIARRHLPRSYSRELPRLANGRAPGTARVYELALELISHSHGRVDGDALVAFVGAYQAAQPLKLGELWAIPIMLRLALLENLRRVIAGVVAGRHARERAGYWVDAMVAASAVDPQRLVLVLADIVETKEPLTIAFVAELASRLQAQGPALQFAMDWLEQRLASDGQTIEHVFHLASQSQASDQVSVSNSIGGLRYLGATDWRDFVEATSVVEATLRRDPVYGAMDFTTRDRYRHVVEAIARRVGAPSDNAEPAVARAAIALALARDEHVGRLLVTPARRDLEAHVGLRVSLVMRARRVVYRARTGLYVGAIVGLTGLVAALGMALLGVPPDVAGAAAWWVLLALCASQIAIAVVNTATTMLVGPTPLPRLDFSAEPGGIPAAHASVVAVPAMLTDVAEIDALVEALEVRFLANRDEHLAFALLTDFRDAPSAEMPEDAALLAYARHAIDALTTKYLTTPGGGFFLFHRARVFSPGEGAWLGWERKRGKLEDFNRALRGDASRFACIVGDVARLQHVRYVIALDADTALPRDAARLLAGTMAHPLNRPVYDAARGRVGAGYAILQPRVEVSLASTTRTRFARLFAGEPGIDPYTRAVSDVFQDLFQEGSFVGKGIYDVDMVTRALAGRLPDNRVLSHDLLEGAFARSGLVSDVVLVEDFPYAHAAEVSRRVRWVRGDWQIASWLRRRVPTTGARLANPLSLLSQWKILDNLRRSALPVALLALLAVGWARAETAAFATLAVATLLVLPGALAAVTALWRRPDEQRRWAHAKEIGRGVLRQLAREGFALAALPYDALRALGAIGQTLYRLTISHRHLLVWRTARDAQRAAQAGLVGSYLGLWVGPALAIAATVVLAVTTPATLIWAGPILLTWLVMPALSWWLSRPLSSPRARLEPDDVAFLRAVARRTWRFFETFVGAEDHYLPPDNFQEDPPVGVAHRTSPTNIGLSLTANLAAYDLGYITAGGLLRRTSLTLGSLGRLHRHRGHFYNWYDTRTLEPLPPTYISTVDSGNLSGHLLTLASGLEELAAPALGPQIRAGLVDTLAAWRACATPSARAAIDQLVSELAAAGPDAWQALLARLLAAATALVAATPEPADAADAADALAWARAFEAACRDALGELAAAAREPHAAQRAAEVKALAAQCRALAELEYAFLYDRTRHLLSVGYDVAEHRLDTSNYDLLASEARLASYIGIAQGKLPQEHWFSLGRQLTATAGRPTLLSWSGSMFEYLMPLLVMPSFARTLLDETCRAVVLRQIEHGKSLGLPWGVSESGYFKTDAGLNYQYRAFGVPGLGFKRGLSEDRVVAPYASALALMVAPEAACANLRRLAGLGHLGRHGFYEAIDFTPSRLPPDAEHVTVRSYMAHHQGMVFLSLVHLLCDRPMQRRFETDPAFRATELLLQERIPRVTTIYPHPPEFAATTTTPDDAEHSLRVFTTPNTLLPEVHLLSNGHYHVVVTNAGGGYSRWGELAVTRWHEDLTRDCWGTFGYLRDVTSGAFWSLAHQPTLVPATSYEAIFTQGRAEFRRLDGEIYTHVEISVSPEDDVEVRRVTLTNRGRTQRTIELTSYAEVVLARPAADAAHPAFSNLFVQTELVPDQEAIVVTRRPRSGTERPPWMMHHVTVDGTTSGPVSYETSRDAFLGRGRTTADPIALHRATLGDSQGAVLDPIVAIRRVVVLEPHASARLQIVTGVAATREGAIELIEKYRDRHAAARVFELSWTHSQVLQRRLEASNLDIQLYERLVSHVLYASAALRAPRSLIMRNRGGQSGLWAYGISGDWPIVLVRVVDFAGSDLVRQLVKAHAYWRLKGVCADLVVWIEDPSGYRQVLMDEILAAVARVSEPAWLDKPGGIFVRRSEQISEEDKILMQTVARVIVSDQHGSLADQIERRPGFDARRPSDEPAVVPVPVPPDDDAVGVERPDLHAFNGLGGFTRDGKEYVITTTRDRRTAAPWVNVLANPYFGSVVSESGSAYTWCENAHGYRLTPWSNDAVSDGCGEALYLKDEETGRYWSPTPLPAGTVGPYTTRHGFGYTIFEATESGLTTTLTTYVAVDAPVKFVVLAVHNRSGRPRRLSLTAMFELVLGEGRAANMPHVVTELDLKTGGLFARNAYNGAFAARVAFLDCSEERRTVSGDRAELLGRNGSAARPAALRRTRLSGRVGAALDPCMAMQTNIELADGQEQEVAFTFGSGRDLGDARTLITRFRGTGPARAALAHVWQHWNDLLGAVRIETPDPALDFLANGWLTYQVLSARMWGRSGFYQSGGAFGFRDQLQDAMALVYAAPGLLREQLLRSAGRQFREGDVQHWWHPPEGRGVRTHISDDYLWLPHALCRYVAVVGDTGVMDVQVGFLDGRAVRGDEDSYYDLPARSEEVGSLYEHCVLAIRHGLRFGVHGLPLMGSGDWNDGMNLVGEGGKGESVWLGFFLFDVLTRFAPLARARGDLAFADLCTTEATLLRAHLEAHGWDGPEGQWYRRAYFDSGTPLGSAENVECQIDSLPQSWAVLSGAGEPERTRMALAAVDRRLVRRDLGVIQLFDPPFDTSDLKPGYVKGYLPGVRENGGQYTHAAIWTAMAFAASGDVEKAWELFGLINPVRHGDSRAAIATYRVEPYVVAADVYVNPQHAGRGGWTWYTGSAGWMYRLVVESLLGLRLEVDRLRFAPLMPATWAGFVLHYRHRSARYHIHVTHHDRSQPGGHSVREVTCDGVVQPDASVMLVDDGADHAVTVSVGP